MTQRKDGRWLKVITTNGKKLYFYSSEPTEKKAEKDIQKQILAYREKEANGVKFSDAADEYYESTDGKIAETTRHRYNSHVNRAKEFFGDEYMKDITIKDIEKFLGQMVQKGYANKTIRGQHSLLCLIFHYACVNFNLQNDPTRYVTVPKGKGIVTREALTEQEQKIVNDSIDKPFGLFAYTLMYTGLRRGEAIALKYSDIDFDKKIICVQRTAVYAGANDPIIKEPKTAAGKRSIVLLDCLAEKLPHKNTDEYVFTGDKVMGNSWYTRRWEEYQKATGLTVTPHQLRHTFATILYEAEVLDKDAQSILGHADIATTRNIYTHIRETRISATADKLNAFINSSQNPKNESKNSQTIDIPQN